MTKKTERALTVEDFKRMAESLDKAGTPIALRTLTLKEYLSLKASGMLWEFYPEATGSPSEDLDDSD